jgi:hypothetical protein
MFTSALGDHLDTSNRPIVVFFIRGEADSVTVANVTCDLG